MFISKFKFDTEKAKSYASGFECGLKTGRKEAMFAKYTPNEIRKILGFSSGINDGLNIRFSAVEETVNARKVREDKNDPVNRPSHYTAGGIECIDAIEASMTPTEYAGFLKGQVLKYVWRYRLKGKPTEDLKKARFYLDRLIQITEKEETV
jgi:hypothetical protein